MNSTMQALHSRSSANVNRLCEPAPNDEELAQIMQSAMSAPDHKLLRPWDYRIIRGDARKKLGALFAEALSEWEDSPSQKERDKLASKALRAPLMIAGIVRGVPDNPKVPISEQIASVSCGMHAMLLAAQSLGYGAVWLSGPMAYSDAVCAAFELGEHDTMMGFLYIGTPEDGVPDKNRPDHEDFFSVWEP